MKKIFFLIIVAFIASASCCKSGDPTAPITYGYKVLQAQVSNLSRVRFDSACNADGITSNLAKWRNGSFVDYETKDRVDEYMFLKFDSLKNTTTFSTRIKTSASNDTTFVYEKRTIKTYQEK